MTGRWSNLLCCLMVAGALTGCGGSSGLPDLGQVEGTVTLDDKPLTGLLIIFEPETGRAATGMTDDSGQYELEYTYQNPGCKTGPNKVRFEWPLDAGGPALPARYTSNSELKVNVEPGDNTHDFKLTSGGETAAAAPHAD